MLGLLVMSRSFKIVNPSKMYLKGFDSKLLGEYLKYEDKKVDYELKNFIKNKWFRTKYGEDVYKERLDILKKSKIKSLLFEDEEGLWTYPGLLYYLKDKYPEAEVSSDVVYPESKLVPWEHIPDYELRDYQDKAILLLEQGKHAGIEYATGSGKSKIVIHLIKNHGLKSLVVTPSISIAEQMYSELLLLFGKKKVGKYFGGKKEPKKQIIVAVAQSLTRIEKDSEDWEELGKCKVLAFDESHLTAAQTLSEICFGLVKNVPYRYFVSGTQLRNDGLDLLLEAITGNIVYRLSVKDLVDQGYLAKPSFRMIRTNSPITAEPKDPNAYTRTHLYYNTKVNKIAADLANKNAAEGKQVLVLIDEVEQFSYLLPHLKHAVGFAHGGLTKDNKGKVPTEYHDSNPNALVKQFNNKELPILVGTSCISTGTDIQTAKCLIFLKGGKSEIELRQSVGRGTRRVPGKDSFVFYDFDVIVNGNTACITHRHASMRKKTYESIYPDVKEINLL